MSPGLQNEIERYKSRLLKEEQALNVVKMTAAGGLGWSNLDAALVVLRCRQADTDIQGRVCLKRILEEISDETTL